MNTYSCRMFVVAWFAWFGTIPLLAAPLAFQGADSSQIDATSESSGEAAVRLLQEKCWACHSEKKAESGLRLESREAILRGGERGIGVDIESITTEKSLLLRSIDGSDPQLEMPPKNPLKKEEVELIRRWILDKMPWPHGVEGGRGEGNAWEDPENPIRKKFGGQRIDLWSLKPISVQTPPEVQDPLWMKNPIDRWVLSKWEREGRVPRESLEPARLIRRLSLDLTGLPPRYEEIEPFEVISDSDEVKSSLERYIDRLLASPDYGRHFARLWLDVVRYADSNGFDWDEYRKEAWRYRDYVVDSWNRDLPYDVLIQQQLAGDELLEGPPKNRDEQASLIATGYLRLGPQDNAASLFDEQDRSRAELLADLTETTGSAFLGLTLSCCRCHDHKTDPLSHEDHFRLRAFFACVQYGDQVAIDLESTQRELDEINEPIECEIANVDHSLASIPESNKEERKRIKKERDGLVKRLQSPTYGLLMTDSQGKETETYVLDQGDPKSPRQIVKPGIPSVLDPRESELLPVKNPRTNGRRATLARWIASEKNPWTARVMVNRLWQAHFGEGIVATENDFGLSGSQPTHPELLDYLANEFIESGWSIKHIQRLIVTSQTYQQRAGNREGCVSLRPNLRRLSAEALRDRLLFASGNLDHRAGGPPIWPALPAEILQANPAFLDDNETKTKGWYPSPKEQQSVRSLYLIQKRTVRLPWMESFDLPENSCSCPQRESSIVPTQALTLMNNEITIEAAEGMAARFEGEKEAASFITEVFKSAFQRRPIEEELQVSLRFLAEHSRQAFCLSILNANEFLFYE